MVNLAFGVIIYICFGIIISKITRLINFPLFKIISVLFKPVNYLTKAFKK